MASVTLCVCVCVCVCVSRSVLSNSLRPRGLKPARLLCPWNLQARVVEWAALLLLQGIFPTQGSNLGLRLYRWIL